MKFHVNLYATVRVGVANVEAATMEEAIQRAESKALETFPDLVSWNEGGNPDTAGKCEIYSVEYAEEIGNALVDVVGDEEFQQSRSFHFNGNWVPGANPRVLVTVQGGVADYVSDAGIDVEIFDRDIYQVEPDETQANLAVSSYFRDLAEQINVPVKPKEDQE